MIMQNITPEQLKQKLAEENGETFIVVDVREDEEVDLCALPNTLHIPMNEIPLRQNELPDDVDIIIHCHHGVRSQYVIAYLIEAGFESDRLFNLSGGIDAWARNIDPDMIQY